jgi:orotidine-5'-phosphate decarboxylase
MKPSPDPRERLIVALDAPEVAEAERWVAALGDAAVFYKIGMELIYGGGGLALAERLIGDGKLVFIDLKLHDIPNTVERATARLARLGAFFLTVHAYPQTLRAAVAGASGSGLKLLGVSVLTSSDDADLAEAGYAFGARDLVARRAAQAEALGVDGVVASAAEASRLRAERGKSFLLVTPGIRPAGGAAGDQKRVATPGAAIADGADYLVVGRPITAAADPRAAAEAIVAEIAAASATPPPSLRTVGERGPPARKSAAARKGYWIAHVDVADAEAYKAYVTANAVAFSKFGGRFLVRAGEFFPAEGALRARHVVIEFKDYATARACFESAEYSRAMALRAGVSISDLVIVEGYDGPQPG